VTEDLRRSSPVAADGAARFSDRVADYIRYRPTYPPALLDCLSRHYGLRAGRRVADVGSGTGFLTRMLLDHGCEVHAIEPNQAMREAAEHALGQRKGFISVNATAERTTLADGSVDWVMAAQAFHWFDVESCRAEFLRILRCDERSGWVALMWNNRREDTPFLEEYESFLHAHGTDYAAVKHQSVEDDGRLNRFFGGSPPRAHTFTNVQQADLDGLIGRTMSCSYMPGRSDARFGGIVGELARIFGRHQREGRVDFEYTTKLYVSRFKPA